MKNFLCFLVIVAGLALIGFAAFVGYAALFTAHLTDGQSAGAAFICLGSVAVGAVMVGATMSELR